MSFEGSIDVSGARSARHVVARPGGDYLPTVRGLASFAVIPDDRYFWLAAERTSLAIRNGRLGIDFLLAGNGAPARRRITVWVNSFGRDVETLRTQCLLASDGPILVHRGEDVLTCSLDDLPLAASH
ncbi:MAG: hypothetical protein ACAH11_11320 [Sphingomonas sp.]